MHDQRERALSSLTTEDAIAYRAFLRHPSPRARWVGAPQSRSSPRWRPFAGELSARSAAYGLSVLNALYRWLIEQRYVLANPFAGLKVRGGRPAQLDTSHAFTEYEWTLVWVVADGLEWSYGWSERPRSGCASCWTSPTPRACESANSWARIWERLLKSTVFASQVH